MTCTVEGIVFSLRFTGIHWQWFGPSDTPTDCVGDSEQSAKRAMMYRGPGLAKQFEK